MQSRRKSNQVNVPTSRDSEIYSGSLMSGAIHVLGDDYVVPIDEPKSGCDKCEDLFDQQKTSASNPAPTLIDSSRRTHDDCDNDDDESLCDILGGPYKAEPSVEEEVRPENVIHLTYKIIREDKPKPRGKRHDVSWQALKRRSTKEPTESRATLGRPPRAPVPAFLQMNKKSLVRQETGEKNNDAVDVLTPKLQEDDPSEMKELCELLDGASHVPTRSSLRRNRQTQAVDGSDKKPDDDEHELEMDECDEGSKHDDDPNTWESLISVGAFLFSTTCPEPVDAEDKNSDTSKSEELSEPSPPESKHNAEDPKARAYKIRTPLIGVPAFLRNSAGRRQPEPEEEKSGYAVNEQLSDDHDTQQSDAPKAPIARAFKVRKSLKAVPAFRRSSAATARAGAEDKISDTLVSEKLSEDSSTEAKDDAEVRTKPKEAKIQTSLVAVPGFLRRSTGSWRVDAEGKTSDAPSSEKLIEAPCADGKVDSEVPKKPKEPKTRISRVAVPAFLRRSTGSRRSDIEDKNSNSPADEEESDIAKIMGKRLSEGSGVEPKDEVEIPPKAREQRTRKPLIAVPAFLRNSSGSSRVDSEDKNSITHVSETLSEDEEIEGKHDADGPKRQKESKARKPIMGVPAFLRGRSGLGRADAGGKDLDAARDKLSDDSDGQGKGDAEVLSKPKEAKLRTSLMTVPAFLRSSTGPARDDRDDQKNPTVIGRTPVKLRAVPRSEFKDGLVEPPKRGAPLIWIRRSAGRGNKKSLKPDKDNRQRSEHDPDARRSALEVMISQETQSANRGVYRLQRSRGTGHKVEIKKSYSEEEDRDESHDSLSDDSYDSNSDSLSQSVR